MCNSIVLNNICNYIYSFFINIHIIDKISTHYSDIISLSKGDDIAKDGEWCS